MRDGAFLSRKGGLVHCLGCGVTPEFFLKFALTFLPQVPWEPKGLYQRALLVCKMVLRNTAKVIWQKATSLGSIYSIIFTRWQHVSRSWSRLHLGPAFCGRGGRKMSTMVPFERATVVSYRLSIVTVAQSHSAAICHRMSLTLKSTGVGRFGA